MTELKNCPNCNEVLTSSDFCFNCKTWPLGRKQGLSEQAVSNFDDNELVRAVNRATYAIRSIALFFFASLCTSIIGYAIVAAGAGNPISCAALRESCGNSSLVIFGWVVILAGFVSALAIGISELVKSKP